jgi:Zn-dependent protease with chaperone function
MPTKSQNQHQNQLRIDIAGSFVRMFAASMCILSIFSFILPQIQQSKFSIEYIVLFGGFFLIVVLAYFMGPRILRGQAKCKPESINSTFQEILKGTCENLGISKSPRIFTSTSDKIPSPCCIIGNLFGSDLIINNPSIDFLDEEDWRVILSHEISHIKNMDMVFMTWARSYLSIVNYWFLSFAAIIIITQFVSGYSLSL